MPTHVVQAGDFLTRLALEYGSDVDTVWNHANNSDLSQRRSSPDLLLPGDVVFFPDPPAATLSVSPGQTNTFKATVPKVKVRVVLTRDGQPLANKAYVIDGIRPIPPPGQTGGDGKVEFDAPVTAAEALIVLTELHITVRVRIGHLRPETERSGGRQRLLHLGHLGFAAQVPTPPQARPFQ